MIAAAFLVLSVSVACGQEDHERIAEEVAREWAMNEAEAISEEIAAMALQKYGPRVFVEVVEDSVSSSPRSVAARKEEFEGRVPMEANAGQIKESIQWEFGSPIKGEDRVYEAIATASLFFDIAPSESSEFYLRMPRLTYDLEQSYSGSVDYRLEIDTTTKGVIAAKMPLYSVHIYRIPQERTLN
ncbi:MAG: hypothetical protein OXI33_10280 [Chloroflexota bacterium]|nr:hypothetical protein [Chloroflexota bacterium]